MMIRMVSIVVVGLGVAAPLGARGLQEAARTSREKHSCVQRDLHTREGRLESLQALQQAALEAGSGKEWLQAQGLAKAPRLVKGIKVQAGWEAAVEVVLGRWLQSVLVGQDNKYDSKLARLEQASLDLMENNRGGLKPRAGSLAAKVEAPHLARA